MIIDYIKIKELMEKCVIDKSKYVLMKSTSGNITMQINNKSSNYFLHSKYDPIKEGVEYAESHLSDDIYDYVVYGLGLGYHIAAMIDHLTELQNIYIFESDINIIKIAFENTDIKNYFQKENVFFYYVPDKSELINSFSDIVTSLDAKHIFHKSSTKDLPGFVESTESLILSKKGNIKYIAVFKGLSTYDVLRIFTDQMTTCFRALGYKIIINDYDENFFSEIINYREFIDFGFSFNGVAIGLLEIYNIELNKVISIAVDHPIYILERATSKYKNLAFTWVDKDHVDFTKKHIQHTNNFFLPHGGDINVYDDDIFTRKRELDVVFSGSAPLMHNLDAFLNTEFEAYKNIMEILINTSLKYPNVNSTLICEKLLEELESDNTNFLNLLTYFSQRLDKFLRAHDRYNLIKGVLEGGINIHCYGNSWENTEFVNYPNFHYGKAVSYAEQREIFKNTKIILNNMPGFKNGSHERVFSSMIMGALCITNPSNYLKESFVENKEIVFYSFDKLIELPDTINYYIKNDSERIEITKAAHKNAQENHTWFERAKEILRINEITS